MLLVSIFFCTSSETGVSVTDIGFWRTVSLATRASMYPPHKHRNALRTATPVGVLG